MITLKNIRDVIELNSALLLDIYIGKVDASKQKVGFLYERNSPEVLAVGGKALTGYSLVSATLLFQWTSDYTESETDTRNIFDSICYKDFELSSGESLYITPTAYSKPLATGMNKHGNYEFVIDLEILIRKGEQ